MRIQAEMLEHHAQFATAQLSHAFLRRGQNILAVDFDLVGGHLDQARDAAPRPKNSQKLRQRIAG